MVAEFRADAGAHLDEPAVLALADALNRQSPCSPIGGRGTRWSSGKGLREFQHRARQLAFQQITFRLATHPDLKLVMLLDGGERD